jgi:acetoin utilization protein AcuB
MKNTLVKDWMITNVITVGPRTGMLDAHKLMRDHNIRRLPVVKKNNQLIGIVARSDIRKAEPSEATTLNVWEMNYLMSKLQLREIMAKEVITAHVDDTLKSVAMKMQEHKIGALPVVDDHNRVVGIITESDIFRALIAWFNEEEEEAA